MVAFAKDGAGRNRVRISEPDRRWALRRLLAAFDVIRRRWPRGTERALAALLVAIAVRLAGRRPR